MKEGLATGGLRPAHLTKWAEACPPYQVG